MESNRNTFLAVDDRQDNLLTLKALIVEAFPDAEVILTQNGAECIALAKEHAPDVILLDINMPGVDGYDVCRQLKKDTALADIPVIFVTALKSDKDVRLKALDCGAEAFVTKPIDEIELYAQIRSMLKIHQNNLLKKSESDRLNYLVEEQSKDILLLKEKYKSILEDLPVLIYEFLPDSTLTYVNKTCCSYFDATEEELLGKKVLDFLPLSHQKQAIKKYRMLTPQNPTTRYIHPVEFNGKLLWQESRNRAIFNDEGQLLHFYCIGIDVTERRKTENKLLHISYHDYLTGLYNRRYFEEELKRLVQRQNLPLTVIMADVNGLKLINDSFGHKTGDSLLINAANAILSGCRENDVAARIGGDEFSIILPHTTQDAAEAVIGRIKKMIEASIGEKFVLSISFGHSTIQSMEQNINDIFAEAENDMYKNKMFESSSMRSKTIEVIMNSLYEKSQRELAHSQRVGNLCHLIATQLNFGSEESNIMKMAGLVHDIGKIGVDEKVLNKEGRLDEKEWEEIKKHPEAGWRILSSVKEFSEIANYVLSHHERWGGGGYPRGLSGEAIPIESRIIAVADAFDAMTSTRTYSKSMKLDEAIHELQQHAGTQFDPQIVELLIANIHSSKIKLSKNTQSSFDEMFESLKK